MNLAYAAVGIDDVEDAVDESVRLMTQNDGEVSVIACIDFRMGTKNPTIALNIVVRLCFRAATGLGEL